MRLKTILNRIEKHKSFVYKQARFGTDKYGYERIEVSVFPRKNGKAVCSKCGNSGPCYDKLPERAFSYVPIWGLRTCSSAAHLGSFINSVTLFTCFYGRIVFHILNQPTTMLRMSGVDTALNPEDFSPTGPVYISMSGDFNKVSSPYPDLTFDYEKTENNIQVKIPVIKQHAIIILS